VIEPAINPYKGYREQTKTLHSAFEKVVETNAEILASSRNGMAGDYTSLLKRLKEVAASAHEKYSRAGKLNYQELTRYNRIKKLESDIDRAIADNYSPIRRRALTDEKTIIKNTYAGSITALNTIAETRVQPEISGKKISQILSKPWSGVTAKERLYLRQKYLGVQIKGQITRDTMGEGSTYKETSKSLEKIVVRDFSGTSKIVEDIGHQFQTDTQQAVIDRLSEEEIDITKTWVTVADDRVRDAHELLDGQTVSANDMFVIPSGDYRGFKADGPGLFGVPELDINCRCYLVTDVKQKEPRLRKDVPLPKEYDFETTKEVDISKSIYEIQKRLYHDENMKLEGATPRQLDSINNGFEPLRETNTRINSIEFFPDNYDGTAGAAYSPSDQKMYINKANLEKKEEIMEESQRLSLLEAGAAKEHFAREMKNPSGVYYDFDHLTSQYRAYDSVVRWSTASDPSIKDPIAAQITHESYHAIFFEKGISNVWREQMDKNELLPRDFASISLYAFQSGSVEECFAEAAAARKLGLKIPEKINEILDVTLGAMRP